jgi:hypothetical protein
MNAKLILFLSCFAAVTLAASVVNAAPRGGGGMGRGGGHFSSMSARGGNTFARGPGTWSGRNWSGRNWNGRNWNGRNWNNWSGNWRHHHHNNNNDVIFIGSFGFPGWWGWGYPYGSYGYGYPYGYYGYGDYGYGGYGYGGYGNGYSYGYGYDYGQSGYGYGSGTRSRVAELQRRLARAGYYYGAIDGIMGPRTRSAIRAYERDHGYVG